MFNALVYTREGHNMNIVQYKLDIIREVKRNLIALDNGEYTIKGLYFKDLEPEYDLIFSSYSQANLFIIETLLKDLE